jgi:tripartite-type tricarboxylate transporter receptor subunit TctC
MIRALLAVALAAGTFAATAQDYPVKPVRLVVPQAAGGSTDILSRLVGQKIGDALGQQLVVENKAGANGIIGTEIVAKAAPDGYTLLAGGTGTMAINQSLYTKLPFDAAKQLVPVALIAYSTSVLVVHPSVPARNIAELIALVKSKPGELRYASAGAGSSPHLSAEMFKYMTGADIMHIPYKGSTPGVIATMAGETSLMFTGIASAIGLLKDGRLRALSVNGPKRSQSLPEVPTATESGLPGYEVDFWIGIFAPTGTPRPIIARLNAETNRAIVSPDLKDKFLAIGADALGGTPEQLGAILRSDTERWSKAIKATGLKVE